MTAAGFRGVLLGLVLTGAACGDSASATRVVAPRADSDASAGDGGAESGGTDAGTDPKRRFVFTGFVEARDPRDVADFDSPFDGDAPLASLDAGDQARFCDAVADYLLEQVPEEVLAQTSCFTIAQFLLTPNSTQAQCEAAVIDCLEQGEGEVQSTCRFDSVQVQACQLPIRALEVCVTDSARTAAIFARVLSCAPPTGPEEDALAAELDSLMRGDHCGALEAACPGVLADMP